MQGRKSFAPKLFYGINLLDFIGEDHFLVKLDKALSLDWVRKRTRDYYSHTGKPSIDPVVLVKMLLVGYLYDIRSERRLVEEVSLNLAYRWYVGYDLDEKVPNHSIFSKARKRFGKDLFLEVFENILRSCIEAGLLEEAGLLVDSTTIRADASMSSVVELSLPASEYWRELEAEEMENAAKGRKPKGKCAAQIGAPFKGEVDPEKMGRRRRSRNAAYLRKRSTTDRDATMQWRPGVGYSLSYKVHLAADTSGVITAVAVSQSADHDTTKLPELLDRHQRNAGVPEAIAADSHYGTDEALTFLQERGIKAAIPQTGKRKEKHRFPKEAFTYDAQKDQFVCPARKILRRKGKDHKRNRVHYLAQAEDCSCCALSEKCMGKSSAKSRMVTRVENDALEEAERFRNSPRGQELLHLRHTVIEGLFGQAKALHGLSRAKLRGLERVEIQALLTAAALNLKKLVRNTFKDRVNTLFSIGAR